jgi:outer membrane biosynthesis protein TonB
VTGSRRSIPLIGKRNRRPDYVPPAALHNPGLSIPPNRNLARDVKINVKVYVNPSGKVEFSELVSKVSDTDRDLAVWAVFAARRWEFVPARDGDSAVPGEVILHYQFGPPAH